MLQLRFVGISRPPVWLVKPKYTIGGAADCDIVINHDSIMAQHAELLIVDEQLSVIPLHDDGLVLVDNEPVAGQTMLHHGSEVQLGEVQLAVLDPKIDRNPTRAKAETSAPTWFLQGKNTALANKKYPVVGVMIVGRAAECDISLGVAHLSRQHARLRVLEDGLQVEDMNSSNGTYINGKKISGAVARLGDEIRFDTLCFRLSNASEPNDEDPDKTSLRPVLSSAMGRANSAQGPAKPRSAAGPQPKKPAELRPTRPLAPQTSDLDAESTSLLPLFLGIGAVLLATVAVIGYFMV